MDRRQRKTRQAICKAFIDIVSKKHYNQITVGEIIQKADVGRATFYAHFPTKDFLLKEICEELFCHIFDAIDGSNHAHRHIFDCDAPASVVLHLLRHLQTNDNNVLQLLSCENNELFLRYFKENLKLLIQKQPTAFGEKKQKNIPDDFWVNHVAGTFVETIRWWMEKGMEQSPETLSAYFTAAIE